ncbi:helix-turn-helix domain-containing protein [Actinacidiphila oryziradicis]|uniref:Helix-turn-helix domain-containing protein n=1 Tax=Actinacidiphila oryziradicis TaxID=2571141 RepID=A0A4U0T921_9ACTN|nr:helix-turn-helix transcriptional regulator [Actinacidiphila oryziradicis]TKA12535.1 helix-turn-helix domain-containing protein [Actinacidiphila oryziradicis]
MAERRSGGAPTVLRLVLGKRLRELRENAGLSFEQAAQTLDVTHATIRRMEKAEVGLKIPYVEKLLRLYEIPESEAECFLTMARQGNEPGWWHDFRDVLPDWFSAFVSLEGEASMIRAYEPHYVPGLLQTEEYARAVLGAGMPKASAEMLERAVALRTERQKMLARPDPPLLWVVMDETVLRRPVGGPDVMRGQIAALIEAAKKPNVLLQVMPFAAGTHPAMYGPFHIFRFQVRELPDIVCAENLRDAVYFDRYEDVSVFLEALDGACVQAEAPQSTEDILKRLGADLPGR